MLAMAYGFAPAQSPKGYGRIIAICVILALMP